MIDELYRLPETSKWDSNTVQTLNKIFERLHKHSASIEYATTAPTKLDDGVFCIFDDGTEQGLYYKTGKGNMMSTVPRGGIIIWSGAAAAIPTGWALCNGSNGTPDLRDRFVVGVGTTYVVANTGGTTTHTHFFNTSGPINAATGLHHADGDQHHYHDGTTDPSGTLPPYYALCYIMKT